VRILTLWVWQARSVFETKWDQSIFNDRDHGVQNRCGISHEDLMWGPNGGGSSFVADGKVHIHSGDDLRGLGFEEQA
jgi:hypothetical protein